MNKEQIDEWKDHPVTEAFFNKIAEARLEILHNWGNGIYTGETGDATIQLNANAIGQLSGFDQIIEILAEMAGETDEEQREPDPYSASHYT